MNFLNLKHVDLQFAQNRIEGVNGRDKRVGTVADDSEVRLQAGQGTRREVYLLALIPSTCHWRRLACILLHLFLAGHELLSFAHHVNGLWVGHIVVNDLEGIKNMIKNSLKPNPLAI